MFLCLLAFDSPIMTKMTKMGHQFSVAESVREIVRVDVTLQDALFRDMANLSATARSVRPIVEERAHRKVDLDSIISALKRLRRSGKPLSESIRRIMAQSSVSVRTDVSKIVIDRSRVALDIVLRAISSYPDAFIHLSEGTSAITLIIDEKFLERILSRLRGLQLLERKSSLALITMHSPPAIISTPGCVLTIYSRLSISGVNIEDTTSSFTDTIIVVSLEDSGRAFEALTELIRLCRDVEAGRSKMVVGSF
jgi:hypothetical protein